MSNVNIEIVLFNYYSEYYKLPIYSELLYPILLLTKSSEYPIRLLFRILSEILRILICLYSADIISNCYTEYRTVMYRIGYSDNYRNAIYESG